MSENKFEWMGFWFETGCEHILNPSAWDHLSMILLMVLSTQGIKNVLIQISAFTLGHGISMCILGFPHWQIPTCIVELAIASSVVVYGIVIFKSSLSSIPNATRYFSLLAFGILHGLGFIKQTQLFFSQTSIWPVVIGFNLGVEITQLSIAVMIFLFYLLLSKLCSLILLQNIIKITTLCITGTALYFTFLQFFSCIL